jgi:hypothetical protein
METGILLAIIIPPVLVDTTMKVISTNNIIKTSNKRSKKNRVIWLIIIWIINTFGWLSFLLLGRISTKKEISTSLK